MKHKDKVYIARKMLTKQEKAIGTPLFSSDAWLIRKELRMNKNKKK